MSHDCPVGTDAGTFQVSQGVRDRDRVKTETKKRREEPQDSYVSYPQAGEIMTDEEADTLAKRIINTWYGGPPVTEWRIELAPLDAGAAGTAFARLKRRMQHTPSIAEFHNEYRAISTTDTARSPDCETCDNTGWTTAPDHIAYDKQGNEARRYSQVQPCSCRKVQVWA